MGEIISFYKDRQTYGLPVPKRMSQQEGFACRLWNRVLCAAITSPEFQSAARWFVVSFLLWLLEVIAGERFGGMIFTVVVIVSLGRMCIPVIEQVRYLFYEERKSDALHSDWQPPAA